MFTQKSKDKITLPCGCIPGFFLCPEAERLWRIYRACTYEQETEARKAFQEYDDHLENGKLEIAQTINSIKYNYVLC